MYAYLLPVAKVVGNSLFSKVYGSRIVAINDSVA